MVRQKSSRVVKPLPMMGKKAVKMNTSTLPSSNLSRIKESTSSLYKESYDRIMKGQQKLSTDINGLHDVLTKKMEDADVAIENEINNSRNRNSFDMLTKKFKAAFENNNKRCLLLVESTKNMTSQLQMNMGQIAKHRVKT